MPSYLVLRLAMLWRRRSEDRIREFYQVRWHPEQVQDLRKAYHSR